MANLADAREELERNLTSLIDIQHPDLRNLIRETLVFGNIQDTVFYGLVLRRPRAALTFFQAALERQGNAVAIVEPSGNILQAVLRNFTSAVQHQGRIFLGVAPSDFTDELTTSFRLYLNQLQRLNTTVPANLQRLVADERINQPVADIIEELEFMSYFDDAIAGNHATFRDVSWESRGAHAVFIRDALTGRETPVAQLEAQIAPAVLRMRAEVARLVAAGLIPVLDVLVGNFRQRRAGPVVRPNAQIEALLLDGRIPDNYQDPVDQADYPGFEPTAAPSQDASASGTDEEVVETVFWPDVEAFLSTRAGQRPRCLCFCSAELFIPNLTGDDAAQHPDKEPMRRLPCNHVVGDVCMRAWQEKSPRCPWCHQPV